MTSQRKKHLIVITGPTAVGKTGLSIALARYYHTEILSTDSRQFYREMHIGTAKPSFEEQQQVPHHLVDFLSIHQDYDVKQFEENALHILDSIFGRHTVALATGGSGLFIKTLCEGIDEMPAISTEIRQKWQQRLEKEGLPALAALLQQLDPIYHAQADIRNPRRVLRALEVIDVTGTPYSVLRKKSRVHSKEIRDFNIIKIGLTRDRAKLYERIEQRVDLMLQQGLLSEAERLYPFRHLNALQTVGYQEIFPYLEKAYSLEEAIRLIKRNSRRFAKRQMTWFGKQQDFRWFELEAQNEEKVLADIIGYIDEQLNTNQGAS